MATSRPRTLAGVVLGILLVTTAVWLAVQLLRGDPPPPATQPPPPAPTTAPTQTTAAPAFTKEGAVAGLRIIVRKRLEAFNSLNAALLETIYTADCRLANGESCLVADQKFLTGLRRKGHRLQGFPNVIKEIKVLSWEPQSRTAVMRLTYEALPAIVIDSSGQVVAVEKRSARHVVDQVNLVWDGSRWRQAWIGRAEAS